MRKPTFWFPTWSDTNRAVQPQKMARDLKFWIYVVEEVYYPCSENKGADQLRGYRLSVVFAYAKFWFSHDAAHIWIGNTLSYLHQHLNMFLILKACFTLIVRPFGRVFLSWVTERRGRETDRRQFHTESHLT